VPIRTLLLFEFFKFRLVRQCEGIPRDRKMLKFRSDKSVVKIVSSQRKTQYNKSNLTFLTLLKNI
jgi:hypothetical protein